MFILVNSYEHYKTTPENLIRETIYFILNRFLTLVTLTNAIKYFLFT
jgi:hypothetical protein